LYQYTRLKELDNRSDTELDQTNRNFVELICDSLEMCPRITLINGNEVQDELRIRMKFENSCPYRVQHLLPGEKKKKGVLTLKEEYKL